MPKSESTKDIIILLRRNKELEKIRQENFIQNNIREQRKLNNKKLIVIENGK